MELQNLKTKIIGKNIAYYEEIDSTQLEAWRNNKLINGTIIIANKQTLGKGTHGRKWLKNSNQDITFSLKLEPNCNIRKLNNITLDIAKIIVDIFKDLYKMELDIKEPNDIIINGKKMGGILTETKVKGNYINEMVIGIGINIVKQEFPQEIKDIATSVGNETDINVDRIKIISEFCNRFEKMLINRAII